LNKTKRTKRQKEQTTERTKDAPKVADLHERPGRAVQQRVLQLNVPVDHAHAVAVVQPDDQLLKKPPRLVLAQPVLADDVFKHVAPAGKLHRDAEVVRGEEDLLELDDVGVDEAAVVDDLALDVLGDLFGFVCFFDLVFVFDLAALCFFFPSEHGVFSPIFLSWGNETSRGAGSCVGRRPPTRREGGQTASADAGVKEGPARPALLLVAQRALAQSPPRSRRRSPHLVAALDELDRHELARLLVARELDEAKGPAVQVPDLLSWSSSWFAREREGV
jgi:hypothetical protein